MINTHNIRGVLFLVAFGISVPAYSASQTVIPSQTSFNASQNDTIEFTLTYPATSISNTTGLGV